ncbi:ubiquinol-cytochrome c reductase core subunit 1 [Pichia californica]|nr:ubiquinol-cytochrome c reductase core subunit 1 [[Candida] californica]
MYSVRSARQFSTSALRAVSFKTVPASSDSVSSLKVIVKNAGSKSGPSGLAHLVSTSTFLDTPEKSGLRLKREAELLGGEYSAEITRDALILKATFLKEGLPFFVNALGSALAKASFKPHELKEVAGPYASYVNSLKTSCPKTKGIEELHAVTFRSGLGLPLWYDGFKSYSTEDIKTFAKSAFLTENIEIIGENVDSADLQKFVSESSFASLPTGNDVIAQPQPTYTSSESRIRRAGKTSAVLGFAVEDADAFELVAAGLVANAPSTISANVESKVLSYDGASLFYFSVTSSDAAETSKIIKDAAKHLKTLDFSKYAKYASYLAGKPVTSKSVTIPSEFNLVVIGDVDNAPLKSEL